MRGPRAFIIFIAPYQAVIISNSLKSKTNSISLLSPCTPPLLWVICSSQPGHRETSDNQPGQPQGARFNQ